MKKTLNICCLAALAGGGILTMAPAAHAQDAGADADAMVTTGATVDCTALKHTVYVAGSTASQTYLQQIAGQMPGINLIYAANLPAKSLAGSCQGIGDIVTAGQTELGSEFVLLSPSGVSTCLGADGGLYQDSIYVDIGVSDVYPETCIVPAVPAKLPAGFALYDGAIQAMEIAVPFASSQFSISADAAYVVFGFAGEAYMGKMYNVAPWTTSTDIWTRGDVSGTQLMVATAIGLSGAKWLTTLSEDAGTAQIAGGSGAMYTDITTSGTTDPNGTIGILSNAKVDPNKKAGGVKPLAFQGTGQDCGYYPDSDLSTFDKINVRQGRYQIWGPEHFITNVKAGKPVANPNAAMNPVTSADADVQTVINVLTHAGLTTDVTDSGAASLQGIIQAETTAYFIPQCAMQVSRTTEIGPEASYQPPIGCGCFYESLPTGGAGMLSSYCAPCTTKTDCTDKNFPVCNFGYCEAQ